MLINVVDQTDVVNQYATPPTSARFKVLSSVYFIHVRGCDPGFSKDNYAYMIRDIWLML